MGRNGRKQVCLTRFPAFAGLEGGSQSLVRVKKMIGGRRSDKPRAEGRRAVLRIGVGQLEKRGRREEVQGDRLVGITST